MKSEKRNGEIRKRRKKWKRRWKRKKRKENKGREELFRLGGSYDENYDESHLRRIASLRHIEQQIYFNLFV